MSKPLNQFCRNDGYDPSVDYSNSIQETWVHKQVVKKTGEGEDDFIIEEKPVLIERIDLQKRIQEEAKTTDLKALLAALAVQGIADPTGEEPELNKRPGIFADVSGIQAANQGGVLVKPEDIKAGLPEELQGLTIEQLATMSYEELCIYAAKVKASNVKEPEQVKEEPEEEGK